MFLRLFAVFVILPLVELYLLLQLSKATSLGTTLVIVVITGLIGSFLARREGVMAWGRFRTALAEGRMPGKEIQDGMMIIFAAALLLTPGLITDAVGFTLLLPTGRNLFRRVVLPHFASSFHFKVGGETVTRSSRNSSHGVDPNPLDSADGKFSSMDRNRRGDTIDATAVKHRS